MGIHVFREQNQTSHALSLDVAESLVVCFNIVVVLENGILGSTLAHSETTPQRNRK